MIDLNSTIISQYANSPILMAWLQALNSSFDPAASVDSFKTLIWNAPTNPDPTNANITYGLDLWGRIVGANRVLYTTPSNSYVAFNEAGSPSLYTAMTMGDGAGNGGVFWGGNPLSPSYTTVGNADFQKIILGKALANISGCSVPSINRILRTLFGSQGPQSTPTSVAGFPFYQGRVCVYDWDKSGNAAGTTSLNMATSINFEGFTPSDLTKSIITYSTIIPHSAGVAVTPYYNTAAFH
jgi:hypothetical protein